jgi:hypothetical protein
MFAVNGPSGPTTRHERRRRPDAELAAEEKRKQQEVQRKRDRFFQAAKQKNEEEGKEAIADGEGGEEDRDARDAQPSSGIFKVACGTFSVCTGIR